MSSRRARGKLHRISSAHEEPVDIRGECVLLDSDELHIVRIDDEPFIVKPGEHAYLNVPTSVLNVLREKHADSITVTALS
ncbi:MAG: hypothetical protein ABI548_04635 [Polyangiaceae bacterium]